MPHQSKFTESPEKRIEFIFRFNVTFGEGCTLSYTKNGDKWAVAIGKSVTIRLFIFITSDETTGQVLDGDVFPFEIKTDGKLTVDNGNLAIPNCDNTTFHNEIDSQWVHNKFSVNVEESGKTVNMPILVRIKVMLWKNLTNRF
jgi:hypothetical protein